MSNDEWRTPRPIFEALNSEFHIHVDAAASPDNHLVPYVRTEHAGGPRVSLWTPPR